MTNPSNSKRGGKKKKLRLLLIIVGCFFFLVGLIILFLPRIISSSLTESIASSIASDKVGTPIQTGDISWRWHKPLRMTHVEFGESGSIVSIDSIEVPLTFWQIATLQYQDLNTITIEGMDAEITRQADGTFNFQEVIDRLPKSDPSEKTEQSPPSPFPIQSVSFVLNNSKITYDDQVLQSNGSLSLDQNRIDWPSIQQPLTFDLSGELASSGEVLPWDLRGKIENIVGTNGLVSLDKLKWTVSSDGMNGPHQLTESGFFLSGNLTEPTAVFRLLLNEEELTGLTKSWVDPAQFGSPSGIIDFQTHISPVADSEFLELSSTLKINEQSIVHELLGTESFEFEPVLFEAKLIASQDGSIIQTIAVKLDSQFADLDYHNVEASIEIPFSFLPDALSLNIDIGRTMELVNVLAPDLPADFSGRHFNLEMSKQDQFTYAFHALSNGIEVELPSSDFALPEAYGSFGMNGEIVYSDDLISISNLMLDSPLLKLQGNKFNFNMKSKQFSGDALLHGLSADILQLANISVPLNLCFLDNTFVEANFSGNTEQVFADYFLSIPEMTLPNDVPLSATILEGSSSIELGVAIKTENVIELRNETLQLNTESSTGSKITAYAHYHIDPNPYIELFAPDLLVHLEPITGSLDVRNQADHWTIAQRLGTTLTAPDYLIVNDAIELEHFTDVDLAEELVFRSQASASVSDILALNADVTNANHKSSLDFVVAATRFQELQFMLPEPLPILAETESAIVESINTFQLNLSEPLLENFHSTQHLAIGSTAVQTESQFALIDSLDLESTISFDSLQLPVPDDIQLAYQLTGKGMNLNDQLFVSSITNSANTVVNSDSVNASNLKLDLEVSDSPWIQSLQLQVDQLAADPNKAKIDKLAMNLDGQETLAVSADYQFDQKSFSLTHSLTLPLDSLLPEVMNQFMPDAAFMVAVDAINSKGSLSGTIGSNADETLASLIGDAALVVEAPAFANEMGQIASDKLDFTFTADQGSFDSNLNTNLEIFQGMQELTGELNQRISYSAEGLGGQTSLRINSEANSLLTFDFNYENPAKIFTPEQFYDRIPNSALLEMEIDLKTVSGFSDALSADGLFSSNISIDHNNQFLLMEASQSSDNFSFDILNLAQTRGSVLDSNVSFRINKRNDQILRNAEFSLLFPAFNLSMPQLQTTIEEFGIKGNLKADELVLQLEASDFFDGSIGTDARLKMQNDRPILTGFLQGSKINPQAFYDTQGTSKNTVSFVGNYTVPILPDQQALLERVNANIEFFDITPASLRALVRFFGSGQSSIQTASTLAALRLGTPQTAVTKIGYGLLSMSSTLLFQGGIPFNLSIFENQPIGSLASVYLNEETNTLLGLSEKAIRLFFSASGTEFTTNLASFTSNGNENE